MTIHAAIRSVPSTTPVPARYRGVWRRSLLATPDMRDTSTTVFWLQTAQWHADIRIPAQRPDFSGTARLEDCNPQQREWLMRQQGFAGITQVDTTAQRETCTWHRIVDYQPHSAAPDAAFMQFEGTRLIETGVHARYLEHWSPLPDSREGFAVLRSRAANTAEPAQFLMVAGSYVVHVRDRKSAWPEQMAPGDGLHRLTREMQCGLLDFEISFGRRTDTGWLVTHSTLPWLENRSIDMYLAHVRTGDVEIRSGASSTLWEVLEWNPPA